MVPQTQKGLLTGMRFFLSGPIDRVSDNGIEWRRDFRRKCQENGLDIHVFDPTDKPKGLGSETGVEKTMMLSLLKQDKWAEAKAFGKRFRRFDLRGVDWADVIISFIDVNSHLCGTYDETFMGYRESKPVFILLPDGCEKWQLPSWLVTYIDGPNDIFLSVDDIIKHLKKLDSGEYPFDDRFVKIVE